MCTYPKKARKDRGTRKWHQRARGGSRVVCTTRVRSYGGVMGRQARVSGCLPKGSATPVMQRLALRPSASTCTHWQIPRALPLGNTKGSWHCRWFPRTRGFTATGSPSNTRLILNSGRNTMPTKSKQRQRCLCGDASSRRSSLQFGWRHM